MSESSASGATGPGVTQPQQQPDADAAAPVPDCWRAAVLSIIDKLRERKARPDVERIFAMASKQLLGPADSSSSSSSASPAATADMTREGVARVLHQLVQEKLVLPVEYKGSVSYRNVTSWRRRKELAGGRNSPDTTRRVLSAAEGLQQGASFTAQVLHCRMQTVDSQEHQAMAGSDPMSQSSLAEALEREAAAGRLFRVGPGRFQLDLDGSRRQAALRRRKERIQLAKRTAAAAAAAAAASAGGGDGGGDGVGGTTAKRPYKVTLAATAGSVTVTTAAAVLSLPLDLSGSSRRTQPLPPPPQQPQQQQIRQTPDTVSCSGSGSGNSSSEASTVASAAAAAAAVVDVCDFCLSPSTANRMGVPERLLRCSHCSHKAHPSCMLYGPELAARAGSAPWQCTDCKTCCLCSGSGDPDLMLICDACDQGYHLACHRPALADRPAADAKWMCARCCRADGQGDNGGGGDGSSDGVIGQHPPSDASRWSIAQVRCWLQDEGFPLAAQAFVEQEIDGASLMLMKRMDVLTGLGLKLGPAVKVFEKISRLQCRCRTLLQVK